MQVYHDFLRIVLEIINCIITQGLRNNPELVYALLHRQDVFTPFQVPSTPPPPALPSRACLASDTLHPQSNNSFDVANLP